MAPAIVAKMSANAPSHEDVSAFTSTIFTSKTSQDSLDTAYKLTDLLIANVGFSGLSTYGLIEQIKKAAANKKDGAQREGAMFLQGALMERFPPKDSISEVVFMFQYPEVIPVALDALADKSSSVKEGAQYALDTFYNNLKPESMTSALLPILATYLGKRTGKWQGTVGALQLIGKMAEKAKIGMGSQEEEKIKDVLREAMGKRLERLIPIVEGCMHDLKSEVSAIYSLLVNYPLLTISTGCQNSDKDDELSH